MNGRIDEWFLTATEIFPAAESSQGGVQPGLSLAEGGTHLDGGRRRVCWRPGEKKKCEHTSWPGGTFANFPGEPMERLRG